MAHVKRLGMIPPRFAPLAFGFLVSGLMSFLVSGVATARALGLPSDFVGHWFAAWIPAWLVAFPTILVVAPVVRRFVEKHTRSS